MVKGNIYYCEIVYELFLVEFGLYIIRLSVKCYKINEKIYNYIKKIRIFGICILIKRGLFVESIFSSFCVCIEFIINLFIFGINKYLV